MPKRSADYMQKQRERLCEAAVACFRRKGIVGTSLSDICQEAGLSMGALYKHYASRDELLLGVLALRLDRRNASLSGDSWLGLREALLAHQDEVRRDPFWREFQGVADWNEALHALRVKEGQVVLEQIAALLERFGRAGEIRLPFDARRSAQLISVIVDGTTVPMRSAAELQVDRAHLGDYLDLAVGARPPGRT